MKKLLCPLDGSKESERALPLAEALAQRWQAQLLLVRVIEPYLAPPDMLPDLADRVREWSREGPLVYLRQFHDRLGVPTRNLIREGHASYELAEAAREEQADLIVMASREHSAAGRFLMGSSVQGTLRLAPCPVLLLRGSAPTSFERILVPLDGSEEALKALPLVAQFASPGARVTLLRATEANLLPLRPVEREAMLAGLKAELEQTVLPGFEVVRRVEDATPGAAILDRAESDRSELIVMTSHGRSGLSRWLLGSVAEKVAWHAPCPVVILPVHAEAVRERTAAETSASGRQAL
ncbi:universal stress protein [bacterium CPR1]|nr:universal stress protein [bacterium CPR1]